MSISPSTRRDVSITISARPSLCSSALGCQTTTAAPARASVDARTQALNAAFKMKRVCTQRQRWAEG